VYIVGAGFSHYAGLPLQRDFTRAILSAEKFKGSSASKHIVEYLKKFVYRTFGPRRSAKDPTWPDLEDIFTCVDLSANSGHHLGQGYSPARLRTVRRALIARIIWMLRQEYEKAAKRNDTEWQTFGNFLRRINTGATAFVSLNWDVALEHRIMEIYPDITVSYGGGVTPADFPDTGNQICVRPIRVSPLLTVIKIHGSVNWLYCDNCREVFWFPPEKSSRVASQLLRSDDRKRIRYSTSVEQWRCHRCEKVSLGTRIATFSYRKALDYPMFRTSWQAAERLLRNAQRWVFLGYSLPPADYEFKYLLKRVQLSRKSSPELILVAGGERSAAEKTRDNYQAFFGKTVEVHLDGLTPVVIDKITCDV
jgi:hypothetical protein